MNQQFFDDMNLPNQDREILRYMNEEKIDYRNKSFNIDLLREKIHQKK